jgi:hypothetical protein
MESNSKLTTTISDDDVETKERTRKNSKGIMHKIRSRFTKVDSVIQAER